MLIFTTVIRKSADELGTSIDINCRVEVRRFKEEARGTVRWLGLCDDTPAMYLEMVSTVSPYDILINQRDHTQAGGKFHRAKI